MTVAELAQPTVPEPDHVYVLPPDASVTISNGLLKLEPRPTLVHVAKPINRFFRSLAADQKARAIGVVLSGMDSDGADGLRTIKAEGGISIVQEPVSAKFPSMPRSSIAADHVDLIVAPGRIGRELGRIARQVSESGLNRFNPEEIADDALPVRRIFAILQGLSGLDFSRYKPGTIRRRIARRMILKRIDNPMEYADYLETHAEEGRVLQEDLLINVTRFFRDGEVFRELQTALMPRLLASRGADEQVRIWIAGCSTGEEVYSIAMILLECLDEKKGYPPSIQIFGTDASEASLRRARSGVYPESIAADVSAERLRRFFTKGETGYQVTRNLRDICIFARHNLCADPPFSKLDLVSCRNVLIYLAERPQADIIRTFHYSLKATGYLLLGQAESIREEFGLFTAIDRRNRFYAKVPGGENSGFELWRRVSATLVPSSARQAEKRASWSEVDVQKAVERVILGRFAVPCIVVDEHLEIVYTRGQLAPFLDMAPGLPNLQLMRMVRADIAAVVREAVQRAARDDIPVQAEGIRIAEGQRIHDVILEVLPLQSENVIPRCFLILFQEFKDLAAKSDDLALSSSALEIASADGNFLSLQNDLKLTKRYMQSLIADRDTKNEELRSASEEIQSQNEELQSANEELETTKEEIQSANEELQTVNDELQQRNSVLTRTGNDLSNLLASANLPVLMLDSVLQIRQFTPAMERLLNIRTGDIGRPLREIRIQLSIDDLEPFAREVLDTLVMKELEVQDRDKRWHLLRIRPYVTADHRIDGVVLLLMDIDEARRAREILAGSRDFAKAIVENVQIPVVVLTSEFRIRIVNDAFRTLCDSSDLEERSFPDLAIALWEMKEIRPQLEKIRDEGAGARFRFHHEGRDLSYSLTVEGLTVHTGGEQVLLLSFNDDTVQNRAGAISKQERSALEVKVRLGADALTRAQDELRALAGHLFSSQEEERRLVARELHDDITQKLALLDIDIEEFAKDIPGAEIRRRLTDLREQTAGLVEDVRRISHQLHPAMLDELGFSNALQNLTEEFGDREAMPVTYSSSRGPETVPRDVSASLYRIAQESLRNVAKHAGRTHVKVALEGTPDEIRMEVMDFGKGFDTQQPGTGLGLISMVERARLVRGTVTVQSGPGKGTIVSVLVPFGALPHGPLAVDTASLGT